VREWTGGDGMTVNDGEPGAGRVRMAGPWSLPWPFWAILVVGAVLRIAAFAPYSAHHPDESIQYLEQAHRLVFGVGVVPWEFRYFIRSWSIPLALAGPMRLGEWLQPGGMAYLVVPRALVALLNSSAIVSAWVIGARSGRQHATVAMALTAIWVECVLFQVQTLSESLAIASFLGGAALLHAEARMRNVVAAGVLMALAGLLRFQFAPAIAVYAVLVARGDWRLWRGLIAGGIPVVIGGGVIDLAMGLTPYEWILNNYRQNIGAGRMLKIGGVSHWTYLVDISRYWRSLAAPILLLPLLAGKRHRPLLIAAWVNIVIHQLIGHKEWRYLWPSVQILVVLAGTGSVEMARRGLGARQLKRPEGATVTVAIIALWGAASLLLANSETYRIGWRKSGAASQLAAIAARDPRVCAIAAPRYQYTEFGYAFVHRAIPIYLLRTEHAPSMAHPGATAPAYNAILADTDFGPPDGFPKRIACAGDSPDRVCLYVRSGGCAPNSAADKTLYQQILSDVDM
jgi:GPI mannosyltransferase 3